MDGIYFSAREALIISDIPAVCWESGRRIWKRNIRLPWDLNNPVLFAGACAARRIVLARECGLDAGANPGDVVAFCNAGAYCQMVSPNLFLLMETPGFLVYNNTVKDEFSAEAVVCRYGPGYVRSKTLGEAAGAHIDRGGF